VCYALRERTWPALLVVLLLHGPLSAVAGGQTRQVLVLSSSERPHAPQSGFTNALVRDLIRSSREPIQFVEVSVQAARTSGEAPGASTAERIRSAFAADTLDLVMTIGGPAADFAQRFRQQLFPATPMLIAGVDRRFVENGTFTDRETTVATQHDPALMIEEILRLLPETRTVMVVVGASQVEQFWLRQMKREFSRFENRLQFTWTNELSFDEIVQRCRTMPAQSAIFFAILSLDGKGEPRVGGDTVASLHAVANAPMFALYGMGRGIVGGPLLSTDELSRTTAQVALRMLDGETPGSIKTPVQRTGQPTYDARELRRWNIDERRLPMSSVVLFREPTMWERNRRPFMFGALLGVIPVIAIVLLGGVIKRHRTPSRGSVASAALAPAPADATVRVWTAGADGERVEPGEKPAVDITALARARAELSNLSRHLIQAHERERASLARTLHEDVCQRMAALTLRLHTLKDAAHDVEVAAIEEELSILVADIATVSDSVHGRIELLGLTTAGRRFCEELSAKHGLAIHFQAEDVPRDLSPDIALALFRVLQEATINAVVHAEAPEVRVSLRGAAGEIRLHVVDRGVGFDTRRAAPGDGVGLVAIRERLKLVNGDSVIVSSPGEGTRFEAWVPLQSQV